MLNLDRKTAREFTDITYRKLNGVARIAFNRPEVRNAFRPETVAELIEAFHDAREDRSIGVVLFSAEGPSPKDGVWAFCSGGDQRVRGKSGYEGGDGIGRLNILEVQRMRIRDVVAPLPQAAVISDGVDDVEVSGISVQRNVEILASGISIACHLSSQ